MNALPAMPSADAAAPAPTVVGRPAPNTSVVFAWTESIPGAGVCQAGMFTGRFECQVATLSGKPDVLDGVINLVLMGSSEAQTLDISGGLITVYDATMNRVVLAPVTGELDCSTQSFTAAIDPTPSDPMPLERQISWVNLGAQPTTTGMLRGSLDPDLQEIAGDLVINFDPTAFCVGDFSVKRGG